MLGHQVCQCYIKTFRYINRTGAGAGAGAGPGDGAVGDGEGQTLVLYPSHSSYHPQQFSASSSSG